MKLALIRRRFAASGGAELYAQRLMAALVQAGHEVHLFAEHWEQLAADIKFHPLSVSGRRSLRPERFAFAVEDALRQHSFDCIFSLERTRSQDVYRAGDGVHAMWLERRKQFAGGWRRLLVGWGAFHRNMMRLERQTFDPARTGRIIVNSEMVRGEILRSFPFPADRIHLVRNGIDVARFQKGNRAETRARFGVRDNEFLLLFAGSGWERKGLKYLLPVVTRLSGEDVKLLVVGKGTPPAGATFPNVTFAGMMSNVENAFAAADLFTFLPIYEPCANVCLEALAAGLPVVTTIQNGAAELIQPGVNGNVLSDPRDGAALELAIRDWRSQKARRAVPISCDLSLDRNVSETLAILELAAKERAE